MQVRLLDSAVGVPSPAPGRSWRQLDARPSEPAAALGTDRVRFWRPLPRKVVDVVCGEGDADGVPLHTHEALQVLLPTSRFAVVDSAGRETIVHPGVVHVTGPLELHGARSLDSTPFSTRILLVGPEGLTQLGEDVCGRRDGAPPAIAAPGVVHDPWLYAEMRTLFEQLRGPLVALECAPRLLECLRRLIARHTRRGCLLPGPGARSARGVVRARDYLRAHVIDGVTLDQLASEAGLSKFHLLRAFRRAYGLTPHDYLMQLRLARARRLIAEGRPLSHVTYDAGFADQSHLTRRFAEFFGFTPARYARQVARPPSVGFCGASPAGRAAAPLPAA